MVFIIKIMLDFFARIELRETMENIATTEKIAIEKAEAERPK